MNQKKDVVQAVFNTRKHTFMGMRKEVEKQFRNNGHALNKTSLRDLAKKLKKLWQRQILISRPMMI